MDLVKIQSTSQNDPTFPLATCNIIFDKIHQGRDFSCRLGQQGVKKQFGGLATKRPQGTVGCLLVGWSRGVGVSCKGVMSGGGGAWAVFSCRRVPPPCRLPPSAQAQGQGLLQECLAHPHAVVQAVQQRAHRLARPAGLHTVQLLKAASARLGLSPGTAPGDFV